MGLINNIFRWFLLDRMKQIEGFYNFPELIQERVFRELLKSAENTEWGKKYHYSEIKDYNSFRDRVPVQDYNSIKPYVERMMKGEQNLLWPSNINWFAKSSGTTDDRSKFIPMSKESLQDCHYKAGKDMYSLYYSIYPDANLADGKTLVLGGSHQISKLNEDCQYGDLSAVLMQNLPIWAEAKRVPDLSIALMDNWEEKIDKLAKATLNHNITNILGVPTWTVVLIKRLFEMTGKDNLADIWPNLELYVHGGVSFTPYRDLFNQLIRSPKMHYMETYNASEGFFAIQDQADSHDLLLMLDYGIFYEFLAADEGAQPVRLQDVELDKNYAVLISTNAGLWRYMIGDTVKFTSKNPYRLKISGRTKHFINAFGEEVIVENAEKAIAEASNRTAAVVSDFTAAPIYFSDDGNGAHEWLIEFEKEPENINEFAKVLDATLREVNSDYDAKRFKDIALRMPVVRILKKGTFYNWMKKRGKLGGQNKVPRLSNDRQYIENILEFAEVEAVY